MISPCELAELHDVVHLAGEVEPHISSMVIKMSPHSLLTSFYLTSMAIMAFLHRLCCLTSVLCRTNLACQNIDTPR